MTGALIQAGRPDTSSSRACYVGSIVFFRVRCSVCVRCSILILLIKTVSCSIHCSIVLCSINVRCRICSLYHPDFIDKNCLLLHLFFVASFVVAFIQCRILRFSIPHCICFEFLMFSSNKNSLHLTVQLYHKLPNLSPSRMIVLSYQGTRYSVLW
jgi:hypothetical protein